MTSTTQEQQLQIEGKAQGGRGGREVQCAWTEGRRGTVGIAVMRAATFLLAALSFSHSLQAEIITGQRGTPTARAVINFQGMALFEQSRGLTNHSQKAVPPRLPAHPREGGQGGNQPAPAAPAPAPDAAPA